MAEGPWVEVGVRPAQVLSDGAERAPAVVVGGRVDRLGQRGLEVDRRLGLAAVLTLALLTMAGLPPGVAGLLAKVMALRPLATEGLWWVALPAVVAAVIGLAVYLRWVALVLQPGDEHRPPERTDRTATVVAVVTGVVLLAATLVPVLLLGTGTP